MTDKPNRGPNYERQMATARRIMQRDAKLLETLKASDEMTETQRRMYDNAVRHLIEQGRSPDEAHTLAVAALTAPPAVPLPTIDELDDDAARRPPDKLLSLDIDWSECPAVWRHPEYISGALALRDIPRLPVEALIVNYNDGYSVEEVAALFEVPVELVRQVIEYAAKHS